MNSETPDTQPHRAAKPSVDHGGWFATFSLLDVSSTISSLQLQRLVASIARLWRRTVGLLV